MGGLHLHVFGRHLHRTGGRRFLVRISSELKVLKVLKVRENLYATKPGEVQR